MSRSVTIPEVGIDRLLSWRMAYNASFQNVQDSFTLISRMRDGVESLGVISNVMETLC